MPRENAEAKGRRYLTEGRLLLLSVGSSIKARCQGGGEIYTVGYERGRGVASDQDPELPLDSSRSMIAGGDRPGRVAGQLIRPWGRGAEIPPPQPPVTPQFLIEQCRPKGTRGARSGTRARGSGDGTGRAEAFGP